MKLDVFTLDSMTLMDIVKNVHEHADHREKSSKVYGMPERIYFTVYESEEDDAPVVGAASEDAKRAWAYAAENVLKASYGSAI